MKPYCQVKSSKLYNLTCSQSTLNRSAAWAVRIPIYTPIVNSSQHYNYEKASPCIEICKAPQIAKVCSNSELAAWCRCCWRLSLHIYIRSIDHAPTHASIYYTKLLDNNIGKQDHDQYRCACVHRTNSPSAMK